MASGDYKSRSIISLKVVLASHLKVSRRIEKLAQKIAELENEKAVLTVEHQTLTESLRTLGVDPLTIDVAATLRAGVAVGRRKQLMRVLRAILRERYSMSLSELCQEASTYRIAYSRSSLRSAIRRIVTSESGFGYWIDEDGLGYVDLL